MAFLKTVDVPDIKTEVSAPSTSLITDIEVFRRLLRPKPLDPSLRKETLLVLERSYDHLPEVASLKLRASSPDRQLRLLSLDGGGVRGLGSLHILKYIMEQTKFPRLKPCDYFDMIAGTSTGGLIAIMLGRLRMSIDECIQAYTDMAPKIFSNTRGKIAVSTGNPRYSSSNFETVIQNFIKDRTGDSECLMMDSENRCKVFVVAVQADNVNNGIPLHIRTYPSDAKQPSLQGCTIWQACRATAAAPTYFRPMAINGVKYQDGGLGHNNPICLLKAEAEVVFGPDTPIACALSIGTGLVPMLDLRPALNLMGFLKGDLSAALLKLATNTEQHHLLARRLYNSHSKGCYFRFNVGDKLSDREWLRETDKSLYQDIYGGDDSDHLCTPEEWSTALIKLDDHQNMNKFVEACRIYISDSTLEPRVKHCAGALKRDGEMYQLTNYYNS